MSSTYSDYQVYARNMAQSLKNAAAEPSVKVQAQYYAANIGKVKSVDDFVNNYRLFSYAMKANNLEDMVNAKAFMKKVLESNINDSSSFVNTLSDKRYLAFAKNFNFTSTGAVASTADIQTDDQEQDTLGLYTQNAGTSTATTANETYYKKTIDSVTSADGLVNDAKLYTVVLQAYGIDPASVSKDTIKKVLESDLSDSNSFAEKSGNARYKALAADFNFTSTGGIASPLMAQSARDVQTIEQAYTLNAGTGTAAKAAAKTETTYYGDNINQVSSVDELLQNKRLVSYILQANGLSSQNVSTATLKKILTSDLSDPKSFANTQGNASYQTLASTFNFETDGSIAQMPAQQVQSKAGSLATKQGYLQQTMQDEAGKNNAGVQLALYFSSKASSIHSAYDILGDKDLLKVVQTVLNIPAVSVKQNIDLQARTITNGLKISDLQDPAKVAKFVDRFAVLYDLSNNNTSGTTSSSSTNALLGGSSGSSTKTGVLSLF